MTADVGAVSQKLSTGIRLRLSLMMFLQFFVWGAWFVTMGTFLGEGLSASGSQISLAYLTQSLGAILAPLIIGLIADQFFSAQKILGVLHVAGAVLLWIAGDAERFGLSQLHQLRGRVGRGSAPGVCLLVTESPAGTTARERLDAVAGTTDGFELARLDLELRREGDVLGALQSGRRSGLRSTNGSRIVSTMSFMPR